jgi:hypothetical protein
MEVYMTTTSKKTKPKQAMFDEEVTAVYQLEVVPRRKMFEIDIPVDTPEEQHMRDRLHTQAVAVTGRSAIAQFATDQIGDMTSHATAVMTRLMEQVNHYEAAAQVGRFEKPLQNFNNRLLDDTSRYIYEVNWRAVQYMDKDTRTDIYPEKKPAPPKRKGVLRGFKEFWLGEE